MCSNGVLAYPAQLSASQLVITAVVVASVLAVVVNELLVRRSLSGSFVWQEPFVCTSNSAQYHEVAGVNDNKEVVEEKELKGLVEGLRSRNTAGVAKSYQARVRALKGLLQFLDSESESIVDALATDLGRPRFESLAYDIYSVRNEVLNLLGKLNSLTAWKRAAWDSTLLTFPSRGAYMSPEPYGVVLVISTWNFPFMLSLIPLAGALAAGNTVVLKPCTRSKSSARLLSRRLNNYVCRDSLRLVGSQFARDDANAQEEVNYMTALLSIRFDKIFFTGSPRVGRIVAKAAAEYVTPCVLELGGKNPVYVHDDADVTTAARRIVWGRMLNAGQQCVAPDYVCCHERVADEFATACAAQVRSFFGNNPKESPDFGRIVSRRDVERLQNMLAGEHIVCGGVVDANARYVSPTVVKTTNSDSALLQEEIFGPILLILPVSSMCTAINLINSRPKPLSMYVFTKSMTLARTFIARTSAGGVTINGGMQSSFLIFYGLRELLKFAWAQIRFFTEHILIFRLEGSATQGMVSVLPARETSAHLGFARIGSYHGDATFRAFVHYKPVLHKDSSGLLANANFFVYPPFTIIQR